MTHHDWCDPDRCTVGIQPMAASAGSHKGYVVPVLRSDGSTLATVWVEQANGGPPTVAVAHTPAPRWTPDEADAVADALREVAEALRGLR